MQAFGAKVRELRHAKGWSADWLAKQCSLTVGTISRLELGRQDPRLSTVLGIAHALKVPPSQLVEPIEPEYDANER
ncbi:MAG TPA: helix-turn-helix transcriptional regulator [Solirubrobacteraceae bacterium]|nr:helix-turn-helix transcriptional regulator [Solirubrobacteraceae bacterium]